MPTFFVDTNLFLQCREPVELPWRDVAGNDDILILVPRTVQQQIDQLKQSGNSRRARRARKASSLFRRIIGSDDLKFTVCDASPRVVVSFPPPLDPNRERPAALDLTQSDDRIIDETLAYAAMHPDEDVRLLTHDTNPMLTARQCGLPFVAIPEDWLLPPEPDNRDKALAEIKRRLDTLEKDYPQISVEMRNEAGDALSELQMNVTIFVDLAPNEIDLLVEEARARYPMAEAFEGRGKPLPTRSRLLADLFDGGGHYEPPEQDEIERYREIEYPKWLEDVRKFFESLPRQLDCPGRQAVVTFVLANAGARPAENMLVEFEARGGLLLTPPRNKKDDDDGDKENTRIVLPRPPTPPAARYVSGRSALANLTSLSLGDAIRNYRDPVLPHFDRPERDRHAFYWKGGRPMRYTDAWSFICEEFRHKADPEPFEVVVFVPRDVTTTSAVIMCRITARNLPEPVVVTLQVRIEIVKKTTLAEARQILS